MFIKIYALMLMLVVGAAGVLYVNGDVSEMALTAMGFVVSTVLALGIVALLPWWVKKKYTWRYGGTERRRYV